MSRTWHNTPYTMHRKMKHKGYRILEEKAQDELKEEGIIPKNRLSCFMNRIPNPWDDYNFSCSGEYHNKHIYNYPFKNR